MAQRRLLFFSFFFTLFLASPRLWGQARSPFTSLITAISTPVFDTLSGINLDVNLSNPQPKHGHLSLNIIGIGGSGTPYVFELQYTPNAGFVGVDTFVVEKKYAGSYPYLVYQGFRVVVKPSIVKAVDDHITTAEGMPVIIPVLQNDAAAWGPLTIRDIPVVNGGTAYINGNQEIVFTPAAGFSGIAHLNYSVCDALFTCETASVSIGVHNGPDDSDFQTYTDKGYPVDIPLEYGGYILESAAVHGQVQLKNGNEFVYTPGAGYTGSDQFVLKTVVNGVNHLKKILVKVLDTPARNTMAVDDVVYTAQGQPVSFNVRDNDLGNLLVRSWIPSSNFPGTLSGTTTNGNVTFTPNPDFTGLATFTYKIGNPSAPGLETATVSIIVDNLTPPVKFPYKLQTPKETPFVLRYNVPFHNFSFQINGQPQFGTLEYFPGLTTQVVNGQSVSGYNLLVYQPKAGFTGSDEISLVYCAPNNQCRNVHVDIKVVEPDNYDPPYCVSDCVWPGDVNHDYLVNFQDLLPLGYTVGKNGPARQAPSTDWYGQNGDAWNDLFSESATDLKYADTDGNGSIDSQDILAISKNYNLASNLFPTSYKTGKGLPFFVSLLPPDPANDRHFRIQVSLGNNQYPASDVYGLTFDVTLAEGILDSAFHMNYYENSWLNRNSPYLQLSERPYQGRFETAFTRTNGKPASGIGPVGTLDFVVIDIIDVGGQNNKPATVTLHPSILFQDGTTSSGNPITLTLPVRNRNSSNIRQFDDSALEVFPSPANDRLSVHWEIDQPAERLAIHALNGQLMIDQAIQNENQQDALLDVSNLPSGIYMLRLLTQHDVITKKVEINHQ